MGRSVAMGWRVVFFGSSVIHLALTETRAEDRARHRNNVFMAYANVGKSVAFRAELSRVVFSRCVEWSTKEENLPYYV